MFKRGEKGREAKEEKYFTSVNWGGKLAEIDEDYAR